MTRDEAFRLLCTWKIAGDKNHEAFDMALKALMDSDRYRHVTLKDLDSEPMYRKCIYDKATDIYYAKLGKAEALRGLVEEVEE